MVHMIIGNRSYKTKREVLPFHNENGCYRSQSQTAWDEDVPLQVTMERGYHSYSQNASFEVRLSEVDDEVQRIVEEIGEWDNYFFLVTKQTELCDGPEIQKRGTT